MVITVVGYGNVGGTLARTWADAGHQLIVGAHHPDDPRAIKLAEEDGIAVVPVSDSADDDTEVVLLATPASAAVGVADQIAELLPEPGETVFIDATNAVGQRPDPYETAADALADRTGSGHVVKCFNTTGYENMADPNYGDAALDMFVAGDSARAKRVAAELSADAGFAACYDVGDSRFFVSLEHMARIWINMAYAGGHGRGFGFKILHRG